MPDTTEVNGDAPTRVAVAALADRWEAKAAERRAAIIHNPATWQEKQIQAVTTDLLEQWADVLDSCASELRAALGGAHTASSALCHTCGYPLDQHDAEAPETVRREIAHAHRGEVEGVGGGAPSTEEPDCLRCERERVERLPADAPVHERVQRRMILCPDCGYKRCPKAADHRDACPDPRPAKEPCSNCGVSKVGRVHSYFGLGSCEIVRDAPQPTETEIVVKLPEPGGPTVSVPRPRAISPASDPQPAEAPEPVSVNVPPITTDARRLCVACEEALAVTEDGLCGLCVKAVARAQPTEEPRWRTGRTLGRTLYRDGQVVGMVDTRELAEEIVAAMNADGGEEPFDPNFIAARPRGEVKRYTLVPADDPQPPTVPDTPEGA